MSKEVYEEKQRRVQAEISLNNSKQNAAPVVFLLSAFGILILLAGGQQMIHRYEMNHRYDQAIQEKDID